MEEEAVEAGGTIQPLSGSHRSGVVGNDKSTVFVVGFEGYKKRNVPERLKKYPDKKPTAEELERKQLAAADRKKRIDDNKRRQARKVSEEAINFDKKVQARLNGERAQQRWFDFALKK